MKTRPRIAITDDELQQLDLLQFNGGKNPYAEGDPTAERAFARGAPFYRNTVTHRTQFTGGQRVLDLLCGFGRWSIFLAEENDHVVGIDRVKGCVTLARNLCDHLGLDNTEFIQGDVSVTERFADGEFDHVWMWSALQYVDRGRTLAEVRRVLKPGGRLYVANYNSTGLMIQHLMKGIETNQINTGIAQWALSALERGPQGDGEGNYVTVDGGDEMCRRHGLRLVVASAEGGLDLSAGGTKPSFKPRILYDHYHCTVELVAEKPTGVMGGRAGLVSARIGTQIDDARSLVRRGLNRLRKGAGGLEHGSHA